jgi:hypothetical protein
MSRRSDSSLGLLFEIAADPSKALGATSSFRDQVTRALGDVEKQMASTAEVSKGMSAAMSSGFLAAAGVAAALGVSLLKLARDAAQTADKMGDLSEATGLSTDALAAMDQAAHESDESFDALTQTLARLGVNIEKALRDPGGQAAKSLRNLMGSAQDVANLGLLPMDQRIQTVLERIYKLRDEGTRNLALNEQLGKGYLGVAESLKKLAEGYEDVKRRSEESGRALTDEQKRQGDELKKSWMALTDVLEDFTRKFGVQLVPMVTGFFKFIEPQLHSTIKDLNIIIAAAEHIQGLRWGALTEPPGRFKETPGVSVELPKPPRAKTPEELEREEAEQKKRDAEAKKAREELYRAMREKQHWQQVQFDFESRMYDEGLAAAKKYADDKKAIDAFYFDERNRLATVTFNAETELANQSMAISRQMAQEALKNLADQKKAAEDYAAARIYFDEYLAEMQGDIRRRQSAEERKHLEQRVGMWREAAGLMASTLASLVPQYRKWANVAVGAIDLVTDAILNKDHAEQASILARAALRAREEFAEAFASKAGFNFWSAAMHTAAGIGFASLAAAPIVAPALAGGGGGRGGAYGGGGYSEGATAGGGGPAPMAAGARGGSPVRVIVIGQAEAAAWMAGVIDDGVRFGGVRLTATHALGGVP